MPEPIPVLIDYRVEEITHKPTLEAWSLTKNCTSALFLCRVTRRGYEVIDSIPVAVFDLGSEGRRFAHDFLKTGSGVGY